jgi:hypothetical protein
MRWHPMAINAARWHPPSELEGAGSVTIDHSEAIGAQIGRVSCLAGSDFCALVARRLNQGTEAMHGSGGEPPWGQRWLKNRSRGRYKGHNALLAVIELRA